MLRSKLVTAAFWAVCLVAAPVTATGADGTMVLVLGGEAYDGPPKFEVTFAGKTVGEGVVSAAIDTATAGRFADAVNKSRYVQSFTFKLPEAQFKPEGEVRVRLTNEAYGGDGSNRDRNLFLASVSVNGRAVTTSGLTTLSAKGKLPNEALGEFIVLSDGNEEGVSAPPLGGWPAAETQSLAARPPGIGNDKDMSQGVSAALKTGPTTPVAVTVPAVKESLETAALDPDPEGYGPTCDLDEIYNVVGFNENSNELTPRLIERLDQIAADIGARECTVQVTGYSSKQGSYANNALFAIERAQNALRYLRERGVKFVQASATGVGATDQFGPDFRSNRRVVISVLP
jgi:outer membrane protein OmpA-like peptidoglycan-associated protein